MQNRTVGSLGGLCAVCRIKTVLRAGLIEKVRFE